MDNFTTRYLNDNPGCNAWIWEFEDGHKTLVSYGTIVADCSPGGWISVYTMIRSEHRNHIEQFMKEFGVDMDTVDYLYNECATLNIHTGEVVDLYEV